MHYSIDWIKEQFDAQQKLKYIFFWGHRPNPDGSIGKTCMSQWWESNFIVNEKSFASAEHWMMYQKALLFNDFEIAELILSVPSAAEAKKLGRQVRNFDPSIWDEHKFEIVKQGNIYKFQQHDALKNYLLQTGNRVLVEASPYDRIWGIGLSKDSSYIEDPYTWKGENLLGFALMEVRDELA